jgi:hypothetical protein
MAYRPEFLVDGSWVAYGTVFASADECDRYVDHLRRHWHRAEGGRSVRCDGEVTHVMTNVLESVDQARARASSRRHPRLLARVAAFLVV